MRRTILRLERLEDRLVPAFTAGESLVFKFILQRISPVFQSWPTKPTVSSPPIQAPANTRTTLTPPPAKPILVPPKTQQPTNLQDAVFIYDTTIQANLGSLWDVFISNVVDGIGMYRVKDVRTDRAIQTKVTK